MPMSFSEAGIRGARQRWGPPRVLRLDSLPDEEDRELFLALFEALREENRIVARLRAKYGPEPASRANVRLGPP